MSGCCGDWNSAGCPFLMLGYSTPGGVGRQLSGGVGGGGSSQFCPKEKRETPWLVHGVEQLSPLLPSPGGCHLHYPSCSPSPSPRRSGIRLKGPGGKFQASSSS